MFTDHSALVGESLHEAFHYVSSSDPGAVGAGKYWLDTTSSPYTLKKRNGGDSAWVSIGASGGGSTITSATFATSRPGSPVSGDIFVPKDGFFMEVYHDAAWHPYMNGQKLVRPDLATDWDTTNLSPATLTDDAGTLLLTVPSVSGDQLRLVTHAKADGVWNITALIEIPYTDENFIFCGMVLRENSSGKVLAWGFNNQTTVNLRLMSWTDENTYDGGFGLPTITRQPVYLPPRLWLRISNDGSDHTFSWSVDGKYWIPALTQANDLLFTPDEAGFYVDFNNSDGLETAFRVLSWEESA